MRRKYTDTQAEDKFEMFRGPQTVVHYQTKKCLHLEAASQTSHFRSSSIFQGKDDDNAVNVRLYNVYVKTFFIKLCTLHSIYWCKNLSTNNVVSVICKKLIKVINNGYTGRIRM